MNSNKLTINKDQQQVRVPRWGRGGGRGGRNNIFGRCHFQQQQKQKQPLLSSSSQFTIRTVRNHHHQSEIELSSYRPPPPPSPPPATATQKQQQQILQPNVTADTDLSTQLSTSSSSLSSLYDNNIVAHHHQHDHHHEESYQSFDGYVSTLQQQQQQQQNHNESLLTMKEIHRNTNRNVNRNRNLATTKDLPYNDNVNICSHGICCCIQCVRTQEVGIVENCGAFEQIVGPGLYLGGSCWPFNGIITKRLPLRVQQLDMTIESKSKDDVFLSMSIAVQYRVIMQYAYDAYYSLNDTKKQIQTYVFDVVRSIIPKMNLDEIFVSNHYISDIIFCKLQLIMKYYGYEIVSILIGKIKPNILVQNAMNEINVSKRIKEFIIHKAEAERISKVKHAEAMTETMYLSGIGTAKKRAAIAQGLKESMMIIESNNDEKTKNNNELQQDAVDMILLTQYFDTLVAIGADEMFVHNNIMGIPQNFAMQRTE